MAVDFSTTDIDPATGLPKKKTQPQQQLPYLNDGSAKNILPVAPQVQAPQVPNAAVGNSNVMTAAQNVALNTAVPTPVQTQTQQMTQKMMTDPNFGYNAAKQKAATLSAFDANRAASNQKMRQEYSDVAGSGEVQDAIMRVILGQDTDRAMTENALDMEGYQTEKQNWIDSITAGLNQSKADREANTSAVDNLLKTRAAYEGERAQTTAQQYTLQNMTEQQKNDLAKLATQYGYDLGKMSADQVNELTKMAVAQGYNMDTMAQAQQYTLQNMTEQQKNDLSKLAAQYGYDLGKMTADQVNELAKMAVAQGYNMDTMAQAQTYTLQNMTEQQKNDLGKLAAQYGYDINKMTADQVNELAKMAVAQGYNLQTVEAQQKNQLALLEKGYTQDVQKMALQQGYDLEKLDKTFGADMAKLIAATNLDTESKKTLMSLQEQIDTKQLLTQQDFSALQASLQRQADAATQARDIGAAETLTRLKGQIDLAAQQSQNAFEDSQRKATQVWQSGENASAQDFEQAMQYYDWAQKNAAQDNDIEATKAIEQLRTETQLKMQLAGMNHDEKMANVNAAIAEAQAVGDYGREMALTNYRTTMDIEKAKADHALATDAQAVDYLYASALQREDNAVVAALQNQKLLVEAEQAQAQAKMQLFELELQAKGVNLQERDAAWQLLKDGVQSGANTPEDLFEFLQKEQGTLGIQVDPIDPVAVYTEMQKQMDAMKWEFYATHPQLKQDTPEGTAAFNKFYNDIVYGEGSGVSAGTSTTPSQNAANTGLSVISKALNKIM